MIKLLFLCNKKYWDNKMSRVRFHSVDAIFRHKNIIGVKDGKGFDGWIDAEHSVRKHSPDIIFWYKPLEINGYENISIPKIISYNEMYDVEGTKKEILKSKSNIVICHLENDIKKYKNTNFNLYKIPHCIEKTIFKDYKENKKYDVLLAGVISKDVYPLRYKFQKIIKDNLLKNLNTKILSHPGYRIKNVDEQVIRYAKELNKSKLVLSCSSIYKYALAKYVEVPACGSLLLADLPDEQNDFFKNLIIPINISMSEKEIVEIINFWVKSDDEREKKIKLNYKLIMENYTQEYYSEKFYKIIKNYLNNG